MFRKIKKIILLSLWVYLSSVYANELVISLDGVIDLNSKKIINNKITTQISSQVYLIEKGIHYEYVIHKEVFLNSSKEQCYIPLHKGSNDYVIYNIYCYDKEVILDREEPMFYIYNLDGMSLSAFNPEILNHDNQTYGKIENKEIIFHNLNIFSLKNKKYFTSNINCKIPGDSVYNADFDKFQCILEDINSINELMNKVKKNKLPFYFDIQLLEGHLDLIPLKNKTLTNYNNIAYYLQKTGANEEAIFLLEKILEKFPNRTVAYYNIGDAYWELGEKEKAVNAYGTYIVQMKAKGKGGKIPKVLLERVKGYTKPLQ